MYSAWFMCQRACEAIALRLKLLRAVGKHFAKSLADNHGAGSFEIVLPQAPQRVNGNLEAANQGKGMRQMRVVTVFRTIPPTNLSCQCEAEALSERLRLVVLYQTM